MTGNKALKYRSCSVTTCNSPLGTGLCFLSAYFTVVSLTRGGLVVGVSISWGSLSSWGLSLSLVRVSLGGALLGSVSLSLSLILGYSSL